MLINQAVIMAPMPSCRLEGSRHPVTQRPGPRGQSPSQNSTPGRTPGANCPSQCQPFQCPPPHHHHPTLPSFHFLLHSSRFLLPFPPLPPYNSAILFLSTQLRNLLCIPAMNQRGGENEIESEELDVKIRSNKKKNNKTPCRASGI